MRAEIGRNQPLKVRAGGAVHSATAYRNHGHHRRTPPQLLGPDHPGPSAGLAPLYDVASALGLPKGRGRRTPLRLAMAIRGTTALDEIDGAAWEREIERSRLSDSVLAELSALCERVAEAAEGVAERLIAEESLDARYLRRLPRDLTARANGCQLLLSRPR